jgi:hypothetical protein
MYHQYNRNWYTSYRLKLIHINAFSVTAGKARWQETGYQHKQGKADLGFLLRYFVFLNNQFHQHKQQKGDQAIKPSYISLLPQKQGQNKHHQFWPGPKESSTKNIWLVNYGTSLQLKIADPSSTFKMNIHQPWSTQVLPPHKSMPSSWYHAPFLPLCSK